MDFNWKEELEKKPVASTEPVKTIQLSDSDEEEDSFEYKKSPEPLKPVVATAPAAPAPQKPLIEEFEHVTNPIGDFINNTSEKINSRYEDLLSDFGEVKNNLSSNLDHKIGQTVDFLSSERGHRAEAAPLIPSIPQIPVAEPTKAAEPEEEFKNNYDYFEDDSPAVSAHTSPAKKSTIITDLDDKFISSEDLLSDFSKPKPEEQLPAKASVLPSVQKKLEEKFSGALDDLSSKATSGVESLNASLSKVASEPAAVPDIKIVSVQKLFAEYGLGELFSLLF